MRCEAHLNRGGMSTKDMILKARGWGWEVAVSVNRDRYWTAIGEAQVGTLACERERAYACVRVSARVCALVEGGRAG